MNNLKLKLKRIDPVKYGLIIGTSMALMTFVMLTIVFLFSSLIGMGSSIPGLQGGALGAMLGGSFIMVIFIPILYFVLGFIFGWIGTVILNFILSKTGGLDLEFEKTDSINEIGRE